jgi:hypothetical protein
MQQIWLLWLNFVGGGGGVKGFAKLIIFKKEKRKEWRTLVPSA